MRSELKVKHLPMTCHHQTKPNVDLHVNTSALIYAISSRHSSIAALLIDSGADTNLADDRGVTPLIKACFVSDTQIARKLIQNEADVHKVNRTINYHIIKCF